MDHIKRKITYKYNLIVLRFYLFWLNYISPGNFNYLWNFGSMALVCLILQIITGIFLAMHYKSDVGLAFSSIEYISRNVQYGWFLRYLHSNGASVFFLVVYLHIIRSLLFGSFMYPRQFLWITGVIIFLLMIATAFFGYVLPWGQMSYWAATVITSLFTAIPIIGNDFVYWLWGGFSLNDATLNRFFSLHFFLPFLIFGVSVIHLMLLHEFGSNSPSGVISRYDGLLMGPYYIIKDLSGINFMFILIFYLVFSIPNMLGHPDNYLVSSAVVTPSHIVPEWYFLPLYAILRSVTNKLSGIIILALAFICLFSLPYLFNYFGIIRSIYYKPQLKLLIIFFIFNSLFLGWVGGQPVIEPFFSMGKIATCLYFLIFFVSSFSNIIEQFISKRGKRPNKLKLTFTY